ncbi:MAG: hypothetical protein U0H73_04950, partial [Ruminococcus sp.]|nr:hypothetical protein [Ruminococcus sp.]
TTAQQSAHNLFLSHFRLLQNRKSTSMPFQISVANKISMPIGIASISRQPIPIPMTSFSFIYDFTN